MRIFSRNRGEVGRVSCFAVNAIFTKAFPNLPEEQVVLEPAHQDPDMEVGTALQHWHFTSELDEKKVPGKPWLEKLHRHADKHPA
ncbi:MAG: hypothetical protein R2778_00150 [Saprospiraceae bacterium]